MDTLSKSVIELLREEIHSYKGKKLPFDDEKTLLLRDDAKLVKAYLSGGTSFSSKAIAWAADNCSQEIVDAIIASN